MKMHNAESVYDTDIDNGDDDLVAEVVDEFARLVQQGEAPGVSEFASQYPELAPVLKSVLPAIVTIRTEPFTAARGGSSPRSSPRLFGVIGDFRLIREIGRGGMGIVYEAEQLSLGRRVALKTLPAAMALDPARLNRFRNEAQAAAQLNHANIVPVYAVGEDRGVWYYAMQIVDGESLAEFVENKRASRDCEHALATEADEESGIDFVLTSTAPVSRALTECGDQTRFFRQAADLCRQAARGLEHAHAMDIVHRDIKPANLIIDSKGRIWITDFGLARIRDTPSVTATGDLIGTLAYMSPEQAAGNSLVVDQRADIYSLGATLYELITLQPLFTETNRAALINRITSDSIAPPRKAHPTIPVDLETIVMKCLSFEPAHRYQTATELDADLTRFLEDRPIAARRPTLPDQLLKWSRRHRPLVVMGLITLSVLLVGLGISTALIAAEQARTNELLQSVSKREHELRLALMARDAQQEKAELNLLRAERNFEKAREVLDFFLATVNSELPPTEQLASVRETLLEKGLSYYQDFIEEYRGDSKTRGELVRSHRRVASILYEIGSTAEAETALERALQVQEQLARAKPFDHKLRLTLKEMYMSLRAYSDNEIVKLIGEESVRDELSLSPKQIELCEEVLAGYWRPARSVSLRDLTTIRKLIRQRTNEATRQISDLLDSDQYARLRQIDLQVRKNRAWYDRRVIDALVLSSEQREAIRQINEEMERDTARAFRQRRRKKVAGIRREAMESILATLTPEQHQTWSSIVGEPFTGKVRIRLPLWAVTIAFFCHTR